jgi:predicted N-formylglutamate amidohydrolase
MNGLSNILIELRQDLIKEKKGQEFFANLIAKPLLLNKDNSVLFEKSFHTSLAK